MEIGDKVMINGEECEVIDPSQCQVKTPDGTLKYVRPEALEAVVAGEPGAGEGEPETPPAQEGGEGEPETPLAQEGEPGGEGEPETPPAQEGEDEPAQ